MVKCVSHMRGIGQSAKVFAADHEDRFQVATDEYGIANVDRSRNRYAYGSGGELLSWPVAVAQGAGMDFANNWDWGVRATSRTDAKSKLDQIKNELELVTCPSDKVRLATPYWPRNETFGAPNDGLRGLGDPEYPEASTQNMAYWGNLSFGINEDIVGVENAWSGGGDATPYPACWRAAPTGSGWYSCTGERAYRPGTACAESPEGWRLRGNFDRVFRPGDVGLIFEAGQDHADRDPPPGANLILSAKADGPYLGDALMGLAEERVPKRRHPKGAMNILYADLHGGSVRPVNFTNVDGKEIPSEYSPRVRVSPYQPHDTVN
jgi:prepilin-type processing-associated H-X9-DG protein